MTTLAKNEPRTYELGIENFKLLPMIGSDIIYEGAAVGDNGSGFARPLVAADPFRGFANRKGDNAGGIDGDKNVHLRTKGEIHLDVVGVTGEGDKAATVYAIDDDTFTLTALGNTAIGKISRFISGTKVVVLFEAEQEQSI